MKKYLDREEIKRLHSLGMNDNEIARQLKASVNGIRYVRKDVLKLSHNKPIYTINEDMESIIIGTLLGDAWVGYIHKGCKYPKYQTSHSEKQLTYLKTIYESLKPIMTNNVVCSKRKEITIQDKKCIRNNQFLITSRNCENLIIYRNAFYKNNKKIIPVNFLKTRFNDKSLAYWYMDDGSLDRKRHSYIFNTQCFDRENLEEFIQFLLEKFELKFTIKKDNSLYLRHCSNIKFENLIRRFLTEDMQYKIVSS